jgi:hypothetical protein
VNWLATLWGEEWSEYNAWELHWTSDLWGGAFVFLGVLIVLSLWFFWSSLSRVRSPWKKVFLYALRVFVLLLVAMVILQPQLEFAFEKYHCRFARRQQKYDDQNLSF